MTALQSLAESLKAESLASFFLGSETPDAPPQSNKAFWQRAFEVSFHTSRILEEIAHRTCRKALPGITVAGGCYLFGLIRTANVSLIGSCSIIALASVIHVISSHLGKFTPYDLNTVGHMAGLSEVETRDDFQKNHHYTLTIRGDVSHFLHSFATQMLRTTGQGALITATSYALGFPQIATNISATVTGYGALAALVSELISRVLENKWLVSDQVLESLATHKIYPHA